MILVDSDVFIWYFRGNLKAGKLIDSLNSVGISDVVYMELLQGMRNKKELKIFKDFILQRSIMCLPITPAITRKAIGFLEFFSLSHGLRMADALIAATSFVHDETLLTANDDHYRMIPSLSLQVFRPL